MIPFILVCLLTTARPDCNYNTAIEVWQVPPHSTLEGPEPGAGTPFACMLHAQEWAGGHLTIDPNKQWAKVYCVPPEKLPSNVG